MELDRRDFLRLGGVAAFACASGLGLSVPRRAYAVAGVDDALLGGLVLLVATLGGYAFSRSVANSTLDAMGYGFSDFVSDAGNQAAAVTKTLADANNLGVELNRSNAEQAAQSIAAGTGYFAQVMGDAATTGRVALDNFISGAGELPGVLRNLVGSYIGTNVVSGYGAGFSRVMDNATLNDNVVSGGGSLSGYTSLLSVGSVEDILDLSGQSIGAGSSFAINTRLSNNWGETYEEYYFGSFTNSWFTSGILNIYSSDGFTRVTKNWSNAYITETLNSVGISLAPSTQYTKSVAISGNFLGSGALPVVDRAADAPDVIGPGYDSVPLANDLVIDPNTDEVTSAGSLPLPQAIPDVFGDYVGTLEDLLAGVVPGMLGLPISTAEPVVVGTAEGVQSMPISEAVTTETTLAASADVPVPTPPPVSPIEPPVDVPEGPWTPAITLPFEQLWPFNMIYSMVEIFEQLGG